MASNVFHMMDITQTVAWFSEKNIPKISVKTVKMEIDPAEEDKT